MLRKKNSSMQILLVDLGSQYTLRIGRRLRELGVRSSIIPAHRVKDYLASHKPKGIILSGGPASIYDKDAPQIPDEILALNVPLLGICFGMQWLSKTLGGIVTPALHAKEYGRAQLLLGGFDDPLLKGMPKKSLVWASHGDSVVKSSSRFSVIASTKDCPIAAIKASRRNLWGIQFHPEVEETTSGVQIFKNFLAICRTRSDWNARDSIKNIRAHAKKHIPLKTNCLLGFSGGVDSTTLAAILYPVLKKRLVCVTIDAGNLREGELSEIKKNARFIGIEPIILDCTEEFIDSFEEVSAMQAETKRKIFQIKYREVLERAARKARASLLLQGTLAPDMIESAGVGQAQRIKRHHNVGFVSLLKQIHPLQSFFKDEVRELAKTLGLPTAIVERKPFPGPGLFCRIVGTPITAHSLALVRWADAKVRQILKKAKQESEIAQLVVALVGVNTVGVKGDARSYGPAVVVRAVQTTDFMTARGYQFPPEIRRTIAKEITRHPDITRVWFDENDKPPATIELE